MVQLSRYRRLCHYLFFMLLFSGCSSSWIIVQDAAFAGKNQAFLAAKKGGDSGLFILSRHAGRFHLEKKKHLAGIVKKVYNFENIIFVVTENKGIFFFKKNDSGLSKIPIKRKFIPDHRIRNLYWHTQKGSLFITYYTPWGTGVTECKLDKNFRNKSCNTLNKQNSGLKSDYVHQVAEDTRGNTWFRYSPNKDLGVSRLSAKGKWSHFTSFNANLGGNSVNLIVPEHTGEGFPGENVWFVTPAGLSRLIYKENKKGLKSGDEEQEFRGSEIWKFYGDKKTSDNILIRALGIQSWFTEAIIDITDLVVLRDSILFADRNAVYHFNEKNIDRYIPETTGGLGKNSIRKIWYRKNHFFAKIRANDTAYGLVKSIMCFDITRRKWHNISFWHLAKEYPQNIFFIPYDSEHELVILSYKSGASLMALYNISSYSLMEIKQKDIKE